MPSSANRVQRLPRHAAQRASNWVQAQRQPQRHEHDGEGVADQYEGGDAPRLLLIAFGEQIVERGGRQAREEDELRKLLGRPAQEELRKVSPPEPRERAVP